MILSRLPKLARAMLTQFGMSDEFDMVAMETIQNQYLGGMHPLTCSPETQTKIDAKVVEIVREAHTKSTSDFKRKMRRSCMNLPSICMKTETITGEEFMQILQAKNWFVKRMLQKIQRYNREKSENVSDRLFSDFLCMNY